MATYYWVGGNGTWDNASSANWSASSGGAGGAGIPNSTDTVNFDSGSGTAARVTVAATAACTNATINKADITLSLSGSPTFAGLMTFTTGSLALNGFTWTAARIWSNNTNTRSISFGGGKFVATGGGSAGVVAWDFRDLTNLTLTGAYAVDFTYSGSTGSRLIYHASTAGNKEANGLNATVIGGGDSFSNATNTRYANLVFSGFTGTYPIGNGAAQTIYGNLTLSSGMTLTDGANTTTFASTSATPRVITCAGKTLNCNVNFNGVGGSWRFADSFAVGSARTMTLTNGTIDSNGQAVSINTFATAAGGAKTLTTGRSVWTVAGSGVAWNTATDTANVTVNAGASTITMTSASAKTFAGGGKSFGNLTQGGAGALTISGANTFANIANTVQPATITFPASTITTVSAFSVSGTSGNQITLNSSTVGTRATLTAASGTVNVSFCTIQDINATGGAIWNSLTSAGNVDAGNNLNWNFSATPQTVTEVAYSLRSFTTPRRF
jgi:fibronectin-binding autotransporter adhesin